MVECNLPKVKVAGSIPVSRFVPQILNLIPAFFTASVPT